MTGSACGSCGAPTGDGAYLDAGCTRDLAELLRTAASIAGDLDDAVGRLLKRGSGGRASAEVPLPVDLAASAASDALLTVLYGAVRAVSGRPPVAPATIPAMAYWLAQRLDALRQLQDAAQWLDGIRDAVHRALAVIDRKPERVPAGTCGGCGAQLLAELGADEVTCSCGMLTSKLISMRRERAAAADVLGTPAEISAFCKNVLCIDVPRGTITSSVSRGRIPLRPGNVIALSDVLALHAQSTRVRG